VLTLVFKSDLKDSGFEDATYIHSVKHGVQSKTLVKKIRKPSGRQLNKFQVSNYVHSLFLWRFDPTLGHGLPLRGFAITLIGHIDLGRTPLDE
jgi:hypothetical protein